MARRKGTLLDVQPGSYDVFHEEPEGNDTYTYTVETRPDPLVRQEILDANKRQYNDYGDKLSLGKMGEWHHAARIPKDIWDAWLRETNGEVAKDPKILAAKLNDPDNKFLKTAPTNL